MAVFGSCSSGHSKTVTSPTVDGTLTSLGASSVSGSGTGKAAVKDACSLLTTAELEAALGGTVAAGSLTTVPASTEMVCEWTVTPKSGDVFGAELRTSAGSDAEFKQARQAASGPTADVAGVGDEAYSERYVQGSFVFDDLWVRKGTTRFRVEVLSDLGSKPLVQLAQAVITRL